VRESAREGARPEEGPGPRLGLGIPLFRVGWGLSAALDDGGIGAGSGEAGPGTAGATRQHTASSPKHITSSKANTNLKIAAPGNGTQYPSYGKA
jgi:hypothetical protein